MAPSVQVQPTGFAPDAWLERRQALASAAPLGSVAGVAARGPIPRSMPKAGERPHSSGSQARGGATVTGPDARAKDSQV